RGRAAVLQLDGSDVGVVAIPLHREAGEAYVAAVSDPSLVGSKGILVSARIDHRAGGSRGARLCRTAVVLQWSQVWVGTDGEIVRAGHEPRPYDANQIVPGASADEIG